MKIPPKLRQLIAQAAVHVANDVADQIRKENMLGSVQGVLDVIQLRLGHVNFDSMEDAVQKACSSCMKEDLESQAKIGAFVSGIYLQHDIRRAAEVGGSLRKRFGVTWFPHIKERELRFAKEIDSDLEEVLYQKLLEDIEEADATPTEIAEAAHNMYSSRPKSASTSLGLHF